MPTKYSRQRSATVLMVRDMAKDEVAAKDVVALPAVRARMVVRGFVDDVEAAGVGWGGAGVGWGGADDVDATGSGSGTGLEGGPAALRGVRRSSG